jgi:ADP-ribosylation factor GTPase-activating protein 2/3
MSCAAMHKSLGVNISFVRSLSMDTWMENQLKLMALGGNKKLKEFF